MAQFCTKCGTRAEDGTRFCQKCGNPLGADAAPAAAIPTPDSSTTSSAPSVVPPAAPTVPPVVVTPVVVATPPPANQGGGCGKVVVIVLVVVGLLLIAGVGGAVYIAYRAKKKVEEIHKAAQSNDLNKMAEALGGKHVEEKPVEGMPTFPDWSPNASDAVKIGAGTTGNPATGDAGTPTTPEGAGSDKTLGTVVPLRKGLTVVTAIQEPVGDYESYKEITEVTSEAVRLEYRAEVPEGQNPFDPQAQAGPPKMRKVTGPRRILRADLANAHEYAQTFSDVLPLTINGTTALGISAQTFNDLKTTGESPFIYQKSGLLGGLGGLLGGLGGLANPNGGDNKPKPGEKDPMAELQNMSKTNCTLKRADHKTYAFPVLLNDQRVQLPAIRAACKSDDENAEFYFLDDAQNPLSLSWKLGDSERLQVVKIILPVATPPKKSDTESEGAKQLEKKLAEQEKVQIYGIYFDFASAQIKPESKPTLDEIAEVMKLHPDWKLNVAGHTDNVGGDAFNLELSQKRSAAVKEALVTQYKIAPERLVTAGYGASAPVETNTTMEGRARNRRVELSKQ